MRQARILIADSDLGIIKFLRANLKAKDYEVLTAMDGTEAVETIERELPDMVIMELILPGVNGFNILGQLRQWSEIPIIVLGESSDEQERVRCLNLGADDFVTKPFGVGELIARVRAVLRRTQAAGVIPTQPSFISDDLNINFVQRRVTVDSNEIKLTPTEYNLLQELVLNAGKVLTHTHLLNTVWGMEYREEREYLHVFIRRLRAKLEHDPTEPEHITTVSGVGYRFEN